MSDSRTNKLLSQLADILWPIKKSEIRLFLPLSLMMLCMLFNFGTLRSVKDSLIVPNIGPEVISFLKLWCVLPSTIIFTLIYTKLSNHFEQEKIFYIIVSFFLGIFILFTYIILPSQNFYHPSEQTIGNLITTYPYLKWFLKILSKWSYAIIYIFCELWSVVVINLLFWQYANNIFDSESAKRFYPFLGAIGNLGLILAGNILVFCSDLSYIMEDDLLASYNNDVVFQCNMVLKPIMNWVICAGIAAMLLYYYTHNYILAGKNIVSHFPSHNQLDKKPSLSVKDSIKLLLHSKQLGHIALLVLCYGLVINILEGPWKAKIRDLNSNTVDYINFMGQFNIWMGVSSVSFMIIGSNILRRTSWRFAAMITPYTILITGSIFFIFVIISRYFDFSSHWFNPLYWAVVIGALQNILSKSTKYSLFDSTKEMAYLPLSLELKTKGKAAVEVIGLKCGKSMGALVQSMIFILLPTASFDSIVTYLLAIFILIIWLWIWNIKALSIDHMNSK